MTAVICSWCRHEELAGEAHRITAGTTEDGEPTDFYCLDEHDDVIQPAPGRCSICGSTDLCDCPPPF